MTTSLSITSVTAVLLAVTIGFAALIQNRHSAAVIFGIVDRIATMEPLNARTISGTSGRPAKSADRDVGLGLDRPVKGEGYDRIEASFSMPAATSILAPPVPKG